MIRLVDISFLIRLYIGIVLTNSNGLRLFVVAIFGESIFFYQDKL